MIRNSKAATKVHKAACRWCCVTLQSCWLDVIQCHGMDLSACMISVMYLLAANNVAKIGSVERIIETSVAGTCQEY